MLDIEEGIGLKLLKPYILVNTLQLPLLLQFGFQLQGGLVDCSMSCLL